MTGRFRRCAIFAGGVRTRAACVYPVVEGGRHRRALNRRAGDRVWAFSYASELARPGDTGEPVMLTVFEDQTDTEIAQELANQGLIR